MSIAKKIEFHLPSRSGSEREAADRAATVAREMGFSGERVEDLRTAVAEACMNAIEHGNLFAERVLIGVTLTVGEAGLQVDIHDQGSGIGPVPKPDIDRKIEGLERTRGLGIFLIKNLMNEVSFEIKPEGGNVVRMVIYLEPATATEKAAGGSDSRPAITP